MDAFLHWFHMSMARGCDVAALAHPEHADYYRAAPYVVDTIALSWVALTFWLGLCAQWRALGRMLMLGQPASPQAPQSGRLRKMLDDGVELEARYDELGEVKAWVPVPPELKRKEPSIGPRTNTARPGMFHKTEKPN